MNEETKEDDESSKEYCLNSYIQGLEEYTRRWHEKLISIDNEKLISNGNIRSIMNDKEKEMGKTVWILQTIHRQSFILEYQEIAMKGKP